MKNLTKMMPFNKNIGNKANQLILSVLQKQIKIMCSFSLAGLIFEKHRMSDF